MESVTRAFLLSYQPPPHHHSLSLSLSLSLRPAVIPLSAMPPLSSFSPSPLFFFGFLQFPRPGKPCRCKLTEIGNKSRRYRCKTRDTDRPPPRNHLCSSCTRGTWRACFGVIRFLLSDFSAYFFFFFFWKEKFFATTSKEYHPIEKILDFFPPPMIWFIYSKNLLPELVDWGTTNFPSNSLSR